MVGGEPGERVCQDGTTMGEAPDVRYHELLNSGELYDSGKPELMTFQLELVECLRADNATPERLLEAEAKR